MKGIADDIGMTQRQIEQEAESVITPIYGSLEDDPETSTEEDLDFPPQKPEKNTQKIQRLELLRQLAKKHGLIKTEGEKMKPGESGTEKTKFVNGPRLNLDGYDLVTEKKKPETLPSLSNNSENLGAEISASMSLLDDTATHLQGLMKGMTANKPPVEIQVVSTDIMNAAANAANAIYKIKRLKLDAVKMFSEMQRQIK